jgi:hypothetical protein
MSIKEKRKHPRVKIENLVTYVCIDDRGNEIEEGIGQIKNVSLGGILIETIKPIDKIMNMVGRVVYCRENDYGIFRTGIKFLEAKEDIQLFATNLLKIKNEQKTQS